MIYVNWMCAKSVLNYKDPNYVLCQFPHIRNIIVKGIMMRWTKFLSSLNPMFENRFNAVGGQMCLVQVAMTFISDCPFLFVGSGTYYKAWIALHNWNKSLDKRCSQAENEWKRGKIATIKLGKYKCIKKAKANEGKKPLNTNHEEMRELERRKVDCERQKERGREGE